MNAVEENREIILKKKVLENLYWVIFIGLVSFKNII